MHTVGNLPLSGSVATAATNGILFRVPPLRFRSRAGELWRCGVTCNAIAPGYYMANMIEPVSDDPAVVRAFTKALDLYSSVRLE